MGQRKVRTLAEEMLGSIMGHLKGAIKVKLIGFGIFEVREHSTRSALLVMH